MKKFLYFIKWNFTDMQPYSKRMLAYFAIAIVAEYFISGGMIFAPVAIFVDMTQDMFRDRYKQFKKEQTDIIDALKDEG